MGVGTQVTFGLVALGESDVRESDVRENDVRENDGRENDLLRMQQGGGQTRGVHDQA